MAISEPTYLQAHCEHRFLNNVYVRTAESAPLDGCPLCGRYDNEPVFTARDATNDGYLGAYLCPNCGHLWHCSWSRHVGEDGPNWAVA